MVVLVLQVMIGIWVWRLSTSFTTWLRFLWSHMRLGDIFTTLLKYFNRTTFPMLDADLISCQQLDQYEYYSGS